MARQWRIEYPGALYHLLSRGNGHQNIFITDTDRYVFLTLLQEVSERYGIHIFAYVLMGTHYHLLIKTPQANLSKAMQWFGTAYARRFHIHNRTSGHLFHGRYKSILVENDAYLLRLSCYIHRNPLRAGLVNRLVDYPWSSYTYYGYKKKPPVWLDTDMILGQLGGDTCHADYRKMVQNYSHEKTSLWEDVKHGLAYGSHDFLDQLKTHHLKDSKDAELPQHNRLLLDKDPQQMAEQAADAFGLDLAVARDTRRISPQDKNKRDMLIYFLWETGRLGNQPIASIFGVTYSNISRRVRLFKELMEKDNDSKLCYMRIKSQIKV